MTPFNASRPPYADLLEALRRELNPIVAEIVRDVAGPDEDREALAVSVRVAVESTIAALLRAEELGADQRSRLWLAGSLAAREGESLHRLLDRYLTSGWVLWAAATGRSTGSRAAVAGLGTALLKAGDAAAAALAEGYGDAEREIAARTGAARRAFLDELVELPPDDAAAAARITRRAAHFGLASGEAYRVLVAGIGRELEDEGPVILRVALALDRPSRSGGERATSLPIVAAKRGRLVLLARSDWLGVAALDLVLDELAGPEGWLALEAPLATSLAEVAGAFDTAFDAHLVASRLGRHGRHSADDLLLERALLTDERLLRAAVDRELGPILNAPRNGDELVRTVAAYLAARQNLRAAARILGVGLRTVSYRLTRVEELIGQPLAGEVLLRIATALFARRLLGGDPQPTSGSRK
ncbi:MAG: helix-turn-helix domain-containing protein [Chloroflexota bacterium]|nr:helix-turn-helix domain-containing protein [Chloroflexota bacterium]